MSKVKALKLQPKPAFKKRNDLEEKSRLQQTKRKSALRRLLDFLKLKNQAEEQPTPLITTADVVMDAFSTLGMMLALNFSYDPRGEQRSVAQMGPRRANTPNNKLRMGPALRPIPVVANRVFNNNNIKPNFSLPTPSPLNVRKRPKPF